MSIEGFRGSVSSFFDVNTPRVFDGLEFMDISMVRLVKFGEARTCLETAQRHMQSERPKEAIEQIALAFGRLLTEFEYPDWPDKVASPFEFGIPHYGEPVGIEVQEALHRLGSAVRVLSLGLDFRRYAKFSALVPGITLSPEEGYQFQHKPFRTPSSEDCQFCFDFVIDSALRLQEFDFDTK